MRDKHYNTIHNRKTKAKNKKLKKKKIKKFERTYVLTIGCRFCIRESVCF